MRRRIAAALRRLARAVDEPPTDIIFTADRKVVTVDGKVIARHVARRGR